MTLPSLRRPLGEQATVELIGSAAASFPSRRCELTVTDGPDRGRCFSFAKRVVRIGSDPLNDLVLGDPTVSRRHAELELDEQGYRLRDLDSTNGTFVDGNRIDERVLNDRAVLGFGKSSLSFDMMVVGASIEPSRATRMGEIVGASAGLRQIFTVMDKIAPTNLNVVITGDTGTGKELFARAIHLRSRRASSSFVVFDCSAFPASLLESELFGHEKGAFSGAVAQHKGVFEQADGGTLFLDELGEMSVELQPKLLRAIETGEFRRVGGSKAVKVDVRVLAATNRQLEETVQRGAFRRDLYFRLAQVRFHLPPLRDRLDDLELLVATFVDKLAAHEPQRRMPRFGSAALAALSEYDWPGNVRELRNVVERIASLCDTPEVSANFVRGELGLELGASAPTAAARPHASSPALSAVAERSPAASPDAPTSDAIRELVLADYGDAKSLMPIKDAKERLTERFERRYLELLLARHERNLSAAAREAGIDRRHLYRLLKKYGFDRS